VQQVAPRLVRELDDVRLGRDLAPVALGPCPRFRRVGDRVLALDDDLRERRTRTLDLPADARLLTASADLDLVVAATAEELLLVAERTRTLPVPGADSASFVDGRLLLTAPVLGQSEWEGRPYTYRGATTAYLVDVADSAVTSQVDLDVADAGTSAVPHPTDPVVLLDAGEGQDGSRVFAATVHGRQVEGRLLLENAVAAGFSPAGDRLLVTPHPSFGPEVRVLDWPSLSEVARLTSADLGWPDDELDLHGCFLRDDVVLLSTVEHGLVLTDGGLEPVARLDLSEGSPGPDAETTSLVGVADRRFAVELWCEGRQRAGLWEVPALT
jgi:hypothetical protein